MSYEPAPAPVRAGPKGPVQTACQTVLDGGKAGKSRVEIASELDLSLTELQARAAKHPTLRDALTKARDLELAWWEGRAREGVSQGTKFNAALWAKCMAARFPEQSYGETENAAAPPPPDPRERAKAVAALLSALEPDDLDEAPRATKTHGR